MQKKAIDNEIQLMESFRSGSEESYSIIFRQLFPSLCFYAFKLTNDQAAAEDIAEESLIKIWDRRESFFQLNVLKSYLYHTVRNSSINWSRQQKYRLTIKKDIAYISSEIAGSVLDDIVKAEIIGQMTNAMKSLPGKTQQILKLIYFEGKKLREVAKELDVSECTIKTRKAKALVELRKHLGIFLASMLISKFF